MKKSCFPFLSYNNQKADQKVLFFIIFAVMRLCVLCICKFLDLIYSIMAGCTVLILPGTIIGQDRNLSSLSLSGL